MSRAPLALALLVTLVGTTASAQSLPPLPATLAFGDLPALVHDRAPRLAVARARIDEARADALEARTVSNPVLSYELGVLAGGANVNGVYQHDARVEQQIPRPRVRRARLTAAARAVDAATGDSAAFEAELVAEVRRAYVEAWTATREADALAQSVTRIRSALEVLRSRVTAGADAPLDLGRVELELAQLEFDASSLEHDRVDAVARLGALLGEASYRPTIDGSLALDVPATSDAETTTLVDARPEVVAARAAVAAAEAEVTAERARSRPSPSVVVGSMFTQQPSSVAVVGGVSMPLRLFDRNRAEIARAQARADAARGTLAALQLETRSELEATTSRMESLRRLRDATSAPDVERADRVSEAVLRAVRSGSADAYRWLDALRASREARLRGLQVEAQLADATIDWLRLVGR